MSKIIKPSTEILYPRNREASIEMLQDIELAGRVCYKSDDLITDESYEKFIKTVLSRGHEAVIEHGHMKVKIICDRGVTHEIVRHRLASYCQESTRYCNYSKDKFDNQISFILPNWFNNICEGEYSLSSSGMTVYIKTDTGPVIVSDIENDDWDSPEILWLRQQLWSERTYLSLIAKGWTPQEARSVLTNSTKAEIFMTANIREWRHFFDLRDAAPAHPQMREVAGDLHIKARNLIPIVFDVVD